MLTRAPVNVHVYAYRHIDNPGAQLLGGAHQLSKRGVGVQQLSRVADWPARHKPAVSRRIPRSW
jgi:hypothetical protein